MNLLSIHGMGVAIIRASIWVFCLDSLSFSMDVNIVFPMFSFPDKLPSDSFERENKKLEESEIDEQTLFEKQRLFFKNLDYEKLKFFLPNIKNGQDEKGVLSSQSCYNLSGNESYILHSKKIETNHRIFPCLTSADVIDSSYKMDAIYLPKTLSYVGYQVQFFYLIGPSRDKVYILWFEAYNAGKRHLDSIATIVLKRCLNTYFGLVLEVIKEATIDKYLENWREFLELRSLPAVNLLPDVKTTAEESTKSTLIVGGSSVEDKIEREKNQLKIDLEKPSRRGRVDSETQKGDSSKRPSPRIKVSGPLASGSFRESGSLSPFEILPVEKPVAKKKFDLPPLDKVKLGYFSQSCPNSTNSSPHFYKTGLTPKSAHENASGSSRSKKDEIANQNILDNQDFFRFLKANPVYLEEAWEDYQEQQGENDPAPSPRSKSPRRAEYRKSSSGSFRGNPSAPSPGRRKSEKLVTDPSSPLRRRAPSRDLNDLKKQSSSVNRNTDSPSSESPRSFSDSPRSSDSYRSTDSPRSSDSYRSTDSPRSSDSPRSPRSLSVSPRVNKSEDEMK